METLKKTVAQLSPLVLPPKQRREMELGPTLLAHVCFISMFRSLRLSFSFCSDSVLSSLLTASSSNVFVSNASNGRAVHYNGSSLLQWKSVRLDVALLPGNFFFHRIFFIVIL